MQPMTRFLTVSEARAHMKDMIDTAQERIPVQIRRGDQRVVVVDGGLFAELLSKTHAVPTPEVLAENDGWTIVLSGTPISADSTDFNECIEDFLDALQEYADDWVADVELRNARSHRANAPLVALVNNLTRDELRSWVLGRSGESNAESAARTEGHV